MFLSKLATKFYFLNFKERKWILIETINTMLENSSFKGYKMDI
jgi:hypothetical protein